MDFILKKNKEFKTLLNTGSIIHIEYVTEDVNITLTLGKMSLFKYAILTYGFMWTEVLVNKIHLSFQSSGVRIPKFETTYHYSVQYLM